MIVKRLKLADTNYMELLRTNGDADKNVVDKFVKVTLNDSCIIVHVSFSGLA